jgi:hypothetical protein
MPHPGLKVTNRRDFDGRLEGLKKKFFKKFIHFSIDLDIEKDFKKQLQAFVPELFRLDNTNFVKEINGEQITSTQLFEYFRVSHLYLRTNKSPIFRTDITVERK